MLKKSALFWVWILLFTGLSALEWNITVFPSYEVSSLPGGGLVVVSINSIQVVFQEFYLTEGQSVRWNLYVSAGDLVSCSFYPIVGEPGCTISNNLGMAVFRSRYCDEEPIIVVDPYDMEIYSPIGGETWISGTTNIVHYEPLHVTQKFSSSNYEYIETYYWGLSISFDGGISWENIAIFDGSEGVYYFQVPETNSTQCLFNLSLSQTSGSYNWNPYNIVTTDNVFTISSDTFLPNVILTYPSLEGILLKSGETINIGWTKNNVTSVDLDLSTDGGHTWEEIVNDIDTETYAWSVTNFYTSVARIRVQTTEDASVVDYSDHAFEIFNIKIMSPNGGEIWMGGSTQIIHWINPANHPLELFISYDGGNNWSSITTLNGLNGTYFYTVPFVNSTQCKMKIHSTNNISYYDESDSVFTISTSSALPKLILSYPSASGVNMEVGQTVNLSWTRQNVTEVNLELSADNGVNWTEIITGLDANSYSWQVLDNPGLFNRIRVQASLDPGVSDVSDNPFTISNIQLLSPQGGEILTSDYSNGYSLPITWTAAGMTNVKIEYSSNGGVSWVSLNNSYNAATGVYNWVLPGIPSTNYKVRISNAVNVAINSVSESFTLRNPIKLSNANGGGFVTNGSLFNIRWLNQDVDPIWNVWWEYSLNNSTWTRIYTNPTPVVNQQLTWFVSTGLDSSVWLRVINSSDNRIIGKSEASFVVTDKSLVIWSPTGGEEYNALSTQTITWEAQGCANLNIALSTDDGVTWNNIATNVPSSQLTYQWLAPDTPSVNCRIRLSDTTYGYMNLQSEECFSIMPLEIVNPTVDFSADILSGDIPLAVQFTEDVNPGTGNVASRLWDFGDGSTSDQENPLHTYTVAGTYTVSLTITNDFGGSTTETKTDYITALPNNPRIELLSANSLNFGVVYLGDTSPTQTVQVKNIGTLPLTISSVSFHEASSQFTLAENNLPQVVQVDGTAELQVVFIPTVNATVSDSIYINSDASNDPDLAVRLNGTGEYVPPAAVEGVEVIIVGEDAVITWLPVTETIYGTPVTPDRYVVLYNETPYEDDNYYYYLDNTTDLTYAHNDVALFRDAMFYRVVAVKFYRDAEAGILASLRIREKPVSWGSFKELLRNSGGKTIGY